jgi:hypothetical protein
MEEFVYFKTESSCRGRGTKQALISNVGFAMSLRYSRERDKLSALPVSLGLITEPRHASTPQTPRTFI